MGDVAQILGVGPPGSGGGTTIIQLPAASAAVGNNGQVPNNCAICLEAYQPNETITWSTNDECCHAFHVNCITEYLVHLNTSISTTMISSGSNSNEEEDNQAPCPCCRQSFCTIPNLVDE